MTPDTDKKPRSNIVRGDAFKSEHVERVVPGKVQDDSKSDLKLYFNLLFDNRWLISVVTLISALAGGLFAFSTKPVYESSMTIQVEETSPNPTKNILSEASSLFETKKTAIAEIELMRSRMVIAPAIDKLRLDIEAQPKYFPIVRFWSAVADGNELSDPGIFGYGGYVWGAEKIDVTAFNVPAFMLNRIFVIIAQGNNQYRLRDEMTKMTWGGKLGTTLTAQFGGGDIELRVERIDAKPGAEFFLRRLSQQRLIATIQRAMNVVEQGKQSGVISVTLQGETPAFVHSVLYEVGREYLRQNLARKTEDAENSLALLETKLPALKLELERSEAEFNHFRRSQGIINLSEEARLLLEQSAMARKRRFEVLQNRNELLTHLSEEHPRIVGINNQLKDIEAEIKNAADHIKAFPQIEQDELRLTRDIKINTDLYAGLSTMAQQLRILADSKVSNVRMVDAPTEPESPVKPNRPLIISGAVLMGLLLGMAGTLARVSLSGRIDSPQVLEKLLGASSVYASIPHSNDQQQLAEQHSSGDCKRIPLLTIVSPSDPSIDALRNFRTALQFVMPSFRNNIVMMTGPTPRVGKSFVSANLATLIAASGKRVLLIDMDLRNGHLHRYFGTKKENGLYESVTGAAADQIIRHEVMDNLDFIPTGDWTPRQSEFLTLQVFGAWLKTVSSKYDLVLIDAPPVLAVADAVIIGVQAGAVFILARAGMTREDEILESVRRLNQAGIAPEGIVFNDVKARHGVYKYQYKREHPKWIGWKG